jgi:4-hydroxy-tetrahydrodipicolinate synthase
MKKPVFTGSGTALVTPFRNGNIHYKRLAEYIDFQYESGTSAIIVCGTTGECASLSAAEHDALIEFATNYNAGRMKVIAGVGGNNTAACLAHAENALKCGADGLLMVTPYYNKTNQSGLVRHFFTVADAVELPLILYNVPSRTGMTIKPETYATLSAHPNINGVKEASGDFTLISNILCQCDGLWVWSGNDDNTLPMMALGAVGVISVASNIVPSVVTQLCRLCLNGDFRMAQILNRQYFELFHALFMDVNPIPVKAAMELIGMEPGLPRLPLGQLSHQDTQRLATVMQKYGLLEK